MKNVAIRSIYVLLMVIFVFGVQRAFACSCVVDGDASVESRAAKAFIGSSAVFVAKVAGYEFKKGIPAFGINAGDPLFTDPDKFQTRIVKFEFEDIWKGRPSKLVFATSFLKNEAADISHFSSCDVAFEVGARYLVFAVESKGFLRTHACSGTRKLTGSDDEKAILAYLGSLCLPDDPDEPGFALTIDSKDIWTNLF